MSGASLFSSVAVALLLSVGGYAKHSLSLSGAVAAFLIGLVTLLASVRCGVALIVFFVSSSAVTRLGKRRKRQLEGEAFQHGGGRTWVQAVSNAPATLLCVAMLLPGGGGGSARLARAYAAQLAAMQGDTFSSCVQISFCLFMSDCFPLPSELGVLASAPPRLLTTLRPVPPGTNGAVSPGGLAGAAAGGALLGAALAVCDWWQGAASSSPAATIAAAVSWAVAGSLPDSLLGSTLQYSGLDGNQRVVERPGPSVKHICGRAVLDNHQINLLASVLVMLVALVL